MHPAGPGADVRGATASGSRTGSGDGDGGGGGDGDGGDSGGRGSGCGERHYRQAGRRLKGGRGGVVPAVAGDGTLEGGSALS